MHNYSKTVEALTERLGVKRYALYVMDYGAPVGFRLAARHPDRVTALIVQNGNAYAEGIDVFWEPIKKYWASGSVEDREAIRWLTSLKATQWQYTHGVPDTTLVSPDTWTMDQARVDRRTGPGFTPTPANSPAAIEQRWNIAIVMPEPLSGHR